MATVPVNRARPSNRAFCAVDISTASDGLSGDINLTGLCLSCVQISSNWTTAALGFKGCVDGTTTYYPLKDSLGNFLTFSCSAAQVLVFDPAQFKGIERLQLASMTTAGVAVAQAAVRPIKLGLSEV